MATSLIKRDDFVFFDEWIKEHGHSLGSRCDAFIAGRQSLRKELDAANERIKELMIECKLLYLDMTRTK
jgi:hypothetical protein